MLAKVTRPDGSEVSFGYDSLGRRVRKTYRGQTTRWVWDGNVPLHEWVEGQLEPLEEPSAAHAWGEDPLIKKREAELAELLSQGPPARGTKRLPITWLFEPESFAPLAKLVGDARHSIVTDHLGTPVSMLDGQGREVWASEIDTYGALREPRGERSACPFRWPGQYEDVETGLYYNRFRYYDAEAGQYVAQDPIGLWGGRELYSYPLDPLTRFDPLGLTACGEAALDNNALVNAIEGDGAALRALGNRTPVVSPQTVREFLKGSGAQRAALGDAGARQANAKKLREFLSARGGRVGAPSTPSGRAAAEAAGARRTARNVRQGSAGDPAVVDSAVQDGIPLITRDQRLLSNFPFTEPF
ncbi:MAG TPA: RHS repeat-associated core domain-containing protein, partial [Polyangiaceae bacterium]|nr:RHS repeat-associated core domain-containing protein [Polyangiaceae bacterium]